MGAIVIGLFVGAVCVPWAAFLTWTSLNVVNWFVGNLVLILVLCALYPTGLLTPPQQSGMAALIYIYMIAWWCWPWIMIVAVRGNLDFPSGAIMHIIVQAIWVSYIVWRLS